MRAAPVKRASADDSVRYCVHVWSCAIGAVVRRGLAGRPRLYERHCSAQKGVGAAAAMHVNSGILPLPGDQHLYPALEPDGGGP